MKWMIATLLSACSVAWTPLALAQATKGGAEQDGNRNPATETADSQFFTHAYGDNKLEAELGKFALNHGTVPLVRDFGQRMIGDHTLAQQELTRIAQSEHWALPGGLDPLQQSEYTRLTHLAGNAFDRAYMEYVQTAHQSAIDLFQKEAQSGENLQLKQYAARQVPMLKAHEEIARLIQQQSPELGATPGRGK